MSIITQQQPSKPTSSNFFNIHSYIIIFILCIAISSTIILLIILCLYNYFRRRRSKNKAIYYGRNYSTTSSINKRLLSFHGSDHLNSMIPLECGVIRPISNYYGQEMEDLSTIKRYYSTCHSFSLVEIREATNNFDDRNLIGFGCYGKVYRGILLDGTRVVVKELNCTSMTAEEFRLQVLEVPYVIHKNLVKMIGYCVEGDLTRMIVSEYVDNGNLHQWLHGENDGEISPLTWRIRLDIISGIAKGLAYMHEDVTPKMVHGRIKSNNILLDRQWNPKISDFVVGKVISSKHMNSIDVANYSASNLFSGCINEEEDVYSFGVLVMEIISGKEAINFTSQEEQNLETWLKSMVLSQKYEEVVDPTIFEAPPLKELKRVLLMAFRCCDPDAENRPKMGEVIHMLEPRDLLLSNRQETFRRSFSQESPCS